MGNLAYLASRRSSRDSEAGDVAPLNHSRYRRRRTSNFLELPSEFYIDIGLVLLYNISECYFYTKLILLKTK